MTPRSHDKVALMAIELRGMRVILANRVLEVQKVNVSRKGEQWLKVSEDQSSLVECLCGQSPSGASWPPGMLWPQGPVRAQERRESDYEEPSSSWLSLKRGDPVALLTPASTGRGRACLWTTGGSLGREGQAEAELDVSGKPGGYGAPTTQVVLRLMSHHQTCCNDNKHDYNSSSLRNSQLSTPHSFFFFFFFFFFSSLGVQRFWGQGSNLLHRRDNARTRELPPPSLFDCPVVRLGVTGS